jgi:seryl-tRNA synthetase
MLDIKYIREHADTVKDAVKNKKAKVDIDALLKIDTRRRKLIADIEGLNQERGDAAKAKDIERGKLIKENLAVVEAEFKDIDALYMELMYKVPNVPSVDTPVGANEDENQVIRQVGEPTKFDFQPKEHWQLGEALGIIDTETATAVSGSRFAYLKGDLALMEFALIQFVMQTLTNRETLERIIKKAGLSVAPTPFVPVIPPVMIRPEVYARMGRLEPKEERYYIPSDDSYLIGSAEHTLGPMYMDKTLAEKELPLRFIGFSTAFRREAGSYGKDMKGILRLHQFDKLEMESFCVPELSTEEQDFFVACQEHIVSSLGLPYQVLQICTGDMGGPDYRQIDIETWMPGQNRYRETHTSDLMTDYQSRRLNIKVKRDGTGKNEIVHMNDATAAAGRTLISIMENYQQDDGSIAVPEALQPFMFGITKIEKRS